MLPSLIGIIASSGGAVGGDYESIATVTVGAGGSSSIDFTSIPSTYQHLQIRLIGRDNDAGVGPSNGWFRFNSDTGANYATHYIYGDGASALAGGAASTNGIYHWVLGNGATANDFGTEVIDILDYANTNKYKTVRMLSAGDNNGSGRIFLGSGLWQSTSAITSITILPSSSPYKQYSSFALYGIKG